MVRKSLDPDPEQDPDRDFLLDPDSMNMDPKHCINEYVSHYSTDTICRRREITTIFEHCKDSCFSFSVFLNLPRESPVVYIRKLFSYLYCKSTLENNLEGFKK